MTINGSPNWAVGVWELCGAGPARPSVRLVAAVAGCLRTEQKVWGRAWWGARKLENAVCTPLVTGL